MSKRKKKATTSSTTTALRGIQRAWHRAQLKEAKRDLKKTTATEKQHADAVRRFRKHSGALERMKSETTSKRGNKGKR